MEALINNSIAEQISAFLDVELAQVNKVLGAPTKAGMADLAMPCFQFAKAQGCNPAELAGKIATHLQENNIDAQAAGPFLNITLSCSNIAETILSALAENDQQALQSSIGDGKNVCVDFSSPNIAKHLAFHHIRSTGIGNALSRIYKACAWNVTRINFLGDWGTAFGRLIAGWKREGLKLEDLEQSEDKVKFFNELYVRISQAAKEHDSVADEAREWSKKCEEDDPEALQLWEIIRNISLDAAKEIYKLLNINFDDWNGEAHYRKAGDGIVADLDAKGLLTEDDGAKVVDLSDMKMKKPCLILRSDGGTLYATRDMAACEDRKKLYNFNRSLYVVDMGQSLHFKEWFAVIKKLGREYADDLRHIGFGIVQMWDDENQKWARAAARRGVPMTLMDVLQESITRAREIIEEKNPDLPEDEKQDIAKAVGCGAVLFNDLKNNRKGDIKFKFEDALNMQGETGPYLQFAHARLCSIERKFADQFPEPSKADYATLDRDDEKALLLVIARLQSQLERACEDDDPSVLAHAIIDLASHVSSWLSAGSKDHSARVLCDDATTASTRIELVKAARICLGQGLHLLGLHAPQRM